MKHSQTGIAGKLMFLLAGLLFAFTVQAQTISVHGVVTDPTGEPLIGASILAEGTNAGTSTNIDGAYTINVAPTGKLVFSYVGYDTQTVAVEGRQTINVTLQENSVMLNEVVAIGYGVVKKSDATGSVAVIKPDEIEAGLATSVQDMLVGQTPGVVVTTSGGPEGGAQIRIRGGSSLSASNDPLIVIDGVPLDNGGVQGMVNPLSMISPENIESMTVLKDASATAIYGSRASNGVIIITTKKGMSGKPQVSFSANMYVNTARKTFETMSADEFRRAVMDRSPEGSENRALLGDANTNWQDEVLRTTVSSDYNLSIGGTAGWLPYRASVSYTNSNGIIKTSKMDRVVAGFNLTPKFFDNHLSVSLNVKGYYVRNHFGAESTVYEAISYNPTQPVYSNIPIVGGNAGHSMLFNGFYQHTQPNSKGGRDGIGFMNNADINPVSNLMERDNYANVYRSNGNLQLDYSFHFLPELHANLNLGYDVSKTNETNKVAANSGISWKNGNEQYGGGYNDSDGLYQFKSNTLLDFYLNYKKDFDAINSGLDVTAGYSWQRFYSEKHNAGSVPTTAGYYYPYMGADGYIMDVMPETVDKVGVPFFPSPLSEDGLYYEKDHLQLLSFFGRLNYSFMNRYLLTFTVRGDATSRFSKNNRWGVFPSVALAWKINEEAWMQGASGWLSDFKLRLGWGKTGQQEVGSSNSYTTTYQQSQGTSLYPNGMGGWYNPLFPNGVNPNLKWETTTTWNGGFDFGFLNNRINGSIDAYYRKTTDLLSYINVAAGSSTVNMLDCNIGDLENYGVEFNIAAKPVVTRDFTWTLSYNVGWNKNKVTKLNNPDAVYEYKDTPSIGLQGLKAVYNAVGYPAGSFYLLQQVYDESGMPIEGAYVDQDGNGIIDQYDRVFHHSKDPKVTMTFGSQFRYKSWDLGFSLRASLGNYVYNNIESSNGSYSRMFTYGLHNLVKTDYYFEQSQSMSDYYLHNASFLRCDNITLGYTWDNLLNDNLRLRLFGGVQNPFVITKYNGIDPEVASGVENTPYPKATTYSLGVVATF